MLVLSALAAMVVAADTGTVVVTIGDVQIDFSAQSLKTTGRQAPLPKSGAAEAPLWRAAEEGARRHAVRNALAALRHLRICGMQTGAEVIEAEPDTAARIEALLVELKPVDTKFYSDGGVDIVLAGPLAGALLTAIVSGAASEVPEGGRPSEDGTTGIIVQAKGTGTTPALAPRLVDEAGTILYEAAMVTSAALAKRGMAAYYRSLDQAANDARVGGKPLIVKAVRTVEPASSDLVVAASDAAKLERLRGVLAEAKIAIIIDG